MKPSPQASSLAAFLCAMGLDAALSEAICRLYDSWLTGSPVCMAPLRQQLGYKERKEAFLLLHSAEDRYRKLCHTFPHWPARLTQVQLANYIGISPVTLSRVRKRVNTG
ncbi:hypothetical protein JGK42_003628 [Aeromonas veronii]|nr:hypothetical protein [Aeromonas veronii]